MGLLTAYFSLIGVSDATYKRIDCNLSAISMDANNVQKLPAVFTLMDTYGAAVGTFAAYLRLQIMNRDTVLDTISYSSLQSSLTYTVPANKYGIATGIRLTAYGDKEFAKEICHTSVSIVRENPTPFPRSEDWSAGLTYKNGEYLMLDNVVYMWTNPVAGNSAVDPKTDIRQHPDTTSWKSYQEWPLLASQVFLSKWAKLGSSIFDGDYTFSQHGKDAGGNDTDDYRRFDPSKIGHADCPFTPNLMVDWLLGKLVANDVFLKGVIEAVSGKIGDFDIDGGTLENKNKSLAARIISEYIYGSYNLKAVLGSGLPASSGDTQAMYAHSTGKHYGRNIALMLKATGSTWRHDVTGGYANFALHGEGGALLTPAPGDHWEMPGILYGCEVHTARDKSASMSKQWGNGVGVVSFSYNVSLREYYFEIEQGKVNDNLYAFPVAGHIRESGDVGSAHGTCVRNGNRYTVIFWSGGNKVYPQIFQFAIFGRNQ